MSDSKYNLQIKFAVYQDTFEMDSSCSYTPNSEGMDDHIKQWFIDKYQIARDNWENVLYKRERKMKEEQEKRARQELYLELKKEFE